ncbi:MAG: hypothetical protein ACD_64C00072G0001, partial [uncultured bacterium]
SLMCPCIEDIGQAISLCPLQREQAIMQYEYATNVTVSKSLLGCSYKPYQGTICRKIEKYYFFTIYGDSGIRTLNRTFSSAFSG